MGIKVLLVDDERDFLEALSERLAARDFHVHSCLSGEDALERIRAGGIDVVVLDLRMPGMDGVSTLKAMKRIQPSVGVVMLSGQGAISDVVASMRAGAFDYLLKPADMKSLVSKIDAAWRCKEEQEASARDATIEGIALTMNCWE